MTRIHQQQFDKDPREGLTVNCVHPGYVITDATNQKGDLTPDEGIQDVWISASYANSNFILNKRRRCRIVVGNDTSGC